jgi:hypothetical protein
MNINVSTTPPRRIFKMGWVFDDGMSFSGLSSGVSTDGMVVWCSNAISNVVPDLKPGEEILEASAE